MLYMVANVKGEQIQRAVIGASLRYENFAVRFGDALDEVGWIEVFVRYLLEQNVMLGHKMTGTRMQTHHDHGAEQQIEHHVQSETVVDQVVEGQLHYCVQQFPLGDWFRIDEERPENVEHRLQNNPDQFHERRSKDLALQIARYVGVQQFIALVAMMVQMISGSEIECALIGLF